MVKKIKRDRTTILAMYRKTAEEQVRKSITQLVADACEEGYMSTNQQAIIKEIGDKASRTILRHWKALPDTVGEHTQQTIEEVDSDTIRVRGLSEGSGASGD